jgi:hypothetical protein
MDDTISQLCLATFVIAYLALLAALTWWGLGPRLRPTLKRALGLASVRATAFCFGLCGWVA